MLHHFKQHGLHIASVNCSRSVGRRADHLLLLATARGLLWPVTRRPLPAQSKLLCFDHWCDRWYRQAVASELYKRGFNLILHGRNAEKLKQVVEQLKSGGSGKDIKTWVADANSPDVDFEAAAAQWEGLEITLVINNVGSAPVREST